MPFTEFSFIAKITIHKKTTIRLSHIPKRCQATPMQCHECGDDRTPVALPKAPGGVHGAHGVLVRVRQGALDTVIVHDLHTGCIRDGRGEGQKGGGGKRKGTEKRHDNPASQLGAPKHYS
jgi:hypothetical protein